MDIEKVLVSFLKQEALSFFQETSKEYAEKLGVQFSKVAVRDNSTRWGSCSSAQHLSYSWRLGFARCMLPGTLLPTKSRTFKIHGS
ncbi:MAG: DUF45 domain-containing protein [Holosporaceae bacterium]|nr:MAG: DUF45 domain-containing protein [Holosporaceae bacterium]